MSWPRPLTEGCVFTEPLCESYLKNSQWLNGAFTTVRVKQKANMKRQESRQ